MVLSRLPFSWCLAKRPVYSECLVNVPVEFNSTKFALGKPQLTSAPAFLEVEPRSGPRISRAFWCRLVSYTSVENGNPVGSGWWFTDVFYFQLYLKNWKMQHHWTSPGLGTLGKTSSCLTLWYIYIPHHLAPGLRSGACKLRCLEKTGRYREEWSKPKWDLSASQAGGTVLHPNLAAYTQIQSINIIWE